VFLLFTGYEADAATCDYVMVAAESVVVSIKTLPADSPEPRHAVGFGRAPENDEPAETGEGPSETEG
jgi:hypothetical protein